MPQFLELTLLLKDKDIGDLRHLVIVNKNLAFTKAFQQYISKYLKRQIISVF